MTNDTPYNIFSNAQFLDKNRERQMCFYGRVSTEHEAQLSALQNQIQWYDDQLRYHPNWNLVNRYIDEGITGTQARKRPAFLQMIEDAKKGKFDLIVTREVCRFARNTVDTLVYTRELKNKYNIEVYFVEDNIWTMDGDGELRLTIMATLAQEESRKTSERVKAGQKISRDNGVLYGNGNILGYDRVGNTYVINEEQAETVKIIYDLYLNGLGEKKIMNELIRQHRKDGSGNVKWSVSKINRILKRTTYKGVLAYGQSYSNNYLEQKRINNLDANTYIYKEMDIPTIIPSEIWDKVQAIRESKTNIAADKSRGIGRMKSNDIWLSKLRCKCGSSFRKNKWRTNKTTGEEVFGYQCYNQLNNGSKSFREKNGLDTEGYCDIKMIADWKLDLMAKTVISSIWQDRNEAILKAYQKIIDCYENEPSLSSVKIKDITGRIDKAKKKIENLIEMRTEGEITKEEYSQMRSKLDKQIIDLQTELDTTQDINNTKEDIVNHYEEIKASLEEAIDFSQPKLPDYVIDRFIKQITPIDNNTFRWYINIIDNPDSGNPNESIEDAIKNKHIIINKVGVSGRKNNANITINDVNVDSNRKSDANTESNNDNEGGDTDDGGADLQKDLSVYQFHTGGYIRPLGEREFENGTDITLIDNYLHYILVIPFQYARAYRKSSGRYLRCNQWDDLTIEIYMSI